MGPAIAFLVGLFLGTKTNNAPRSRGGGPRTSTANDADPLGEYAARRGSVTVPQTGQGGGGTNVPDARGGGGKAPTAPGAKQPVDQPQANLTEKRR